MSSSFGPSAAFAVWMPLPSASAAHLGVARDIHLGVARDMYIYIYIYIYVHIYIYYFLSAMVSASTAVPPQPAT